VTLAFLLAAALLAVTPGPGLAYVVARTVAGGRAVGFASCAGTAIGGLGHVAAAALGLSALVARSATLFELVKLAGACYLVWLGVKLLRERPGAAPAAARPHGGPRRALLEGVVVEALNVKTALFFLAFLPQFVSLDAPLVPQFALLGTVCVALNTAVDAAAVLAAARLVRAAGPDGRAARWLRRVSGTAMIGLGGALALVRRQA
jgi:threonine/homoserine/homoserine lactone efflux protein